MTEWYYRDALSRKIGPLSTDEFEERVTAGEIQGQTEVWRSGLPGWTTYDALLALEANCVAVASGPAASAAPQSSSQSTSIAHSASTSNRPSRESVTPAATPHLATAPAFELCPGCHEEMPSPLFREAGFRRICGNCVRERRANAARRRLGHARGVDASRLGKYLVRLALVAGAVIAIRILLAGDGGGPPGTASGSPVPEDLAAHPMPQAAK